MHSGIGPAKVLKKHGIPQIKDLPVGRTLQDHVLFGITLEVPQSESIHRLQNSILLALWHFLSYIIWGTGVLAGPPTPRAAWIKVSHLDDKTMKVKPTDEQGNSTSDPLSPKNIPDVEIMSLACSMLDRTLSGNSIISLLNCLAQPKSNGTLELASDDPEAYADVSFPYFTDNADVITARKSMRFTMRVADEFLKNSGYPHRGSILTAPSINRLPKDWEKSDFGEVKRFAITPDPTGRAKQLPSAIRAIIPRSEVEKTCETVTDDEIDTYVRNTAISGNHAASTCRMSVDPNDGVVDQRFKVNGFKNLRVADASALPKLPTGHLMLPVMMFGLRCADFIREDWEGYGR
jgi:choline dehydrogenase-like flavoprotein